MFFQQKGLEMSFKEREVMEGLRLSSRVLGHGDEDLPPSGESLVRGTEEIVVNTIYKRNFFFLCRYIIIHLIMTISYHCCDLYKRNTDIQLIQENNN